MSTATPRTRLRTSALGRKLLSALIAALACFLSLGAPVAPAYAHAGLVSSDPEEGATLDTAPTSIRLTFNEEVGEPAFVTVKGPDGKPQQLDDPSLDGEVVTQALDPDTESAVHPGGEWTVAYRVVSVDGHTVQGHVRFRVTGEAPDRTQSSGEPGTPTATPRPSSNTDSDDEGSGNAAPIVLASSLAVLLVAVTIFQKRRRKE